MREDRVRIVLDPEVTEDNLIPLISKHRWYIVSRHVAKGDRPLEFVYCTSDYANHIHYIEDHRIDIKYLLVTGPQTPDLVELLRRNTYQWPPLAIIQRAREANLSPADRREVLYHLALVKMDHGFDQETFDIYCAAMRDSDPIVRASAVMGSEYLAWLELVEPLRPLTRKAEPDEGVRKHAKRLVRRLDKRSAKTD